jgi:intracellular multiplication protein IcmO
MTKLYAVFGGHLPDPSTSGPEDIVGPEVVGLYLDPVAARSAWNGASYATVDDAHQRYFEVCLHMDVEPKDVTPLEKHVIEMIFTIGTEAQLMQLVIAKMISRGELEPAEKRLVDSFFTPGVEVPLPQWDSPTLRAPTPDTFWFGRVCALCQTVLRPLVYLRDHEGLRLTPETLAKNMSLAAVANLAPREGNPVVPDDLLEPVSSYLDNLPGFREAVDAAYSEHTRDTHGYAEMQVTRPLSHLIYAGVGQNAI